MSSRDEIKKVLKPLIKQCIREVLFEENALSGIITEATKNIQPPNKPLVGQNKTKDTFYSKEEQQELLQKKWKEEQERKRKLLNATGFSGVDVFEGTTPLSKGGNLSEGASSPSGPLGGVEPDDPGVDITGIMALGGGRWGRLAGEK